MASHIEHGTHDPARSAFHDGFFKELHRDVPGRDTARRDPCGRGGVFSPPQSVRAVQKLRGEEEDVGALEQGRRRHDPRNGRGSAS